MRPKKEMRQTNGTMPWSMPSCRHATVRQLEEHEPSAPCPAPSFADVLRDRALSNVNQVPDGYFSMAGELAKHLHLLSSLLHGPELRLVTPSF